MSTASTQKPAAHFCERVSGEAIHFGQNTMVDRTSQEFDLHRWKSLQHFAALQRLRPRAPRVFAAATTGKSRSSQVAKQTAPDGAGAAIVRMGL
jgi:hypothetical protein